MTKPILIIDPGHGGMDPGGGTNKHWKEKNKVLDISLYQYKRFKELGIPVALTRDKDVYLDSGPRTKIVRDSGAKYCISNHINAGGGQGAETIYSRFSEGDVAHAIAKALKEVGQNIRRVFTRKWGNVDYYYMHRETGYVNTAIVEYGFADNETDTQRIKDHWKDYAEAVVKGFCEFIGHKYVAPGEAIKSEPAPKQKVKAKEIVFHLELGDSGQRVKVLQSKLIKLGYDLGAYGADGVYGPTTEKAVKDFQEHEEILVDGIYGPISQKTMESADSIEQELEVDGYLGVNTISALQDYFGTPVDGKISKPSLVIKSLQRWIGVEADGYLGPISISTLQRRLGTPVDGIISEPSLVVKELQRRLNAGKL